MLHGEGLTSLPSACVTFAPYRRALRVTLMQTNWWMVNRPETHTAPEKRGKGKRVTEIDCAPSPCVRWSSKVLSGRRRARLVECATRERGWGYELNEVWLNSSASEYQDLRDRESRCRGGRKADISKGSGSLRGHYCSTGSPMWMERG